MVVTEQDARVVVEIMQESIFQSTISEADGLVFGCTTNMSQAKKVKKFVRLLQAEAQRKGDPCFSIPDLARIAQQNQLNVVSFTDFIDVLNTNGYLLKKGSNMFQLAVSDFTQ